MRAFSLLSLVARIHPEAFDVIIPRYFDVIIRSRAEIAALNPQPLPPGPPPDRFVVEAAVMSNHIAAMALEANVRGESSVDLVNAFVEDWCATPWPRRWPWPWPGPRPDEGPRPEPWQVNTARVVGAIVFASIASRIGDGDLRGAFEQGADRLAEVAAG